MQVDQVEPANRQTRETMSESSSKKNSHGMISVIGKTLTPIAWSFDTWRTSPLITREKSDISRR